MSLLSYALYKDNQVYNALFNHTLPDTNLHAVIPSSSLSINAPLQSSQTNHGQCTEAGTNDTSGLLGSQGAAGRARGTGSGGRR